jgi:hypothetical protein
MRNLYLAQVPIVVEGKTLTLQFDYAAMAAIRGEIGNDDRRSRLLRGTDPKAVQPKLVAIGLQRNHPDWTEERVFEASPPIRPTVLAIEESLNALYFGPDGPPREALENPLMRTLRRAMRFWSPSARRSARA